MATKGIWIPVEVLHDKSLTMQEKLVLLEIEQLQELDTNQCYASNEHFAKLLNTSTKSISNTISSLVKKGRITVELSDRNHTRLLSTKSGGVSTKSGESKDNKTINKDIVGNKLPTTKPKGFKYPSDFEAVWAILRVGDKWKGYKAYDRRIKQGYTQGEIIKVLIAESKKTFAQRHFSTTLNGEIEEIQEVVSQPKVEIINGRKVEVDEDGGFWE